MKAMFIFPLSFVVATQALAADPDYCVAWSRGAAMAAVVPGVTYTRLQDVRTRSYLHCLNLEEGVDEADSIWLADIINRLQHPSPVESGAVSEVPSSTPTVPVTSPPAASARSAALSPGEVCGRVKLRVVWSGKVWHCK